MKKKMLLLARNGVEILLSAVFLFFYIKNKYFSFLMVLMCSIRIVSFRVAIVLDFLLPVLQKTNGSG